MIHRLAKKDWLTPKAILAPMQYSCRTREDPMGHHYHGRTRRDFFRTTFKSALAEATIFEEAFVRAGWARAQSQTATGNLFTIEKVADGIFAALAKPQALTNSN